MFSKFLPGEYAYLFGLAIILLSSFGSCRGVHAFSFEEYERNEAAADQSRDHEVATLKSVRCKAGLRNRTIALVIAQRHSFDVYDFSVKNVESAYSEEKYGFVVSTVNVDGDTYHKYEQEIGGVGYLNDTTYEVTIL